MPLLSLFLALHLVHAQIVGSINTEEGCHCTPACLPTPSCQNGRFLPREDCPCCKVCEGVKGDLCGSQNSICASEFTCSSAGICEDTVKSELFSGKEETLLKFPSKSSSLLVLSTTHNSTILDLPSAAGGTLHYKESNSNADFSRITISSGTSQILVKDLTPVTKYTFKWSGNDGIGSKIEARTQDGCIHRFRSYAVGSTWHEGCLTSCTCHRGGVSDCAPRCLLLAGAIQGDECSERPSPTDPECCVEYVCHKGDNSVHSSPSILSHSDSGSNLRPKLIVTSKMHNSITVAWDDFRNQDPSKSYVTEYREVPKKPISGQIPWMKKVTESGQPPPTMTIGGLKPLTLYEVRVGIFVGSSVDVATDTITVRTESGCVYGNTSFPIGEFFQGCEERCSCAKDGSVKCTERCTIPYFRKGSFRNDPLCLEESNDGDDCCVLVMCAHGDTKGIEEDYDQCANIVCGANAKCVSWPTLSDVTGTNSPQPGSCRCDEGYMGNPNDFTVGCVPDPKLSTNSTHCTYLEENYNPGDVFFDACLFKCICNQQGEIECEPRCNIPPRDKTKKMKDDCHLIPDPDDDCCKIEVCGSKQTESGINNLHAPSLTFDGCYYINNTYKKDEEFTFGCDLKCLCMGFGDVSCFPRCPPVAERVKKEGEICEALVDPTDSCCTISVCDTVSPEIMKEPIIDDDNATNFVEDNEIFLNEPQEDQIPEEDKVIFIEDVKINNNSTDGETETIFKNSSMLTEEERHLIEEDLKFQNSTVAEEAATFMESQNGALLTTVEKEIGEESPNETNVERGRTFIEDIDQIEKTTENINQHLEKKPRVISPSESLEIVKIDPLNTSTVEITLRASQGIITMLLSSASEFITISFSHDSLTWKNISIAVAQVEVENMYNIKFLVDNLDEHDAYQFRASYKDIVTPIVKASLPSIDDSSLIKGELGEENQDAGMMCSYKAQFHKVGDHFYDACTHFCQCLDNLEINCAQIECPTHFGLDILDSGCLEWEDDSVQVTLPPKCCGQIPRCVLHIDHLSCSHNGQDFQHLDFIPQDMIGCDQQCQCISGQLQCDNLCRPVQASPPFDLPCHPSDATLISTHTFPCCTEWQCRNESSDGSLVFPLPWPGGAHGIPGPPAPPPSLVIDDPVVSEVSHDAARISFKIPNEFVGLPGGIFLRYTMNPISKPNPLEWMSEVIHEAGNPLDHEQWLYEKRNLLPGTNYTMQVVLSSHLSRVEITSSNFVVFMPEEVTTPLPHLDIDAELSVSEIQNVSAKLSWKKFNEFELQYVDGIRVRLWKGSKKFPVPVEGPMLHREANYMNLRDLKPNTTYNVDLFFIPHPALSTIISNMKNISFTTLPRPKDKYDFNLVIDGYKTHGDSAEIMFSGAHEPEGKYINVYRIVYRTGDDDQDSQKFKIPKTKKDGIILLTDLEADAVYEVWLEAYLKNGGKKTSNVIQVKTGPGTDFSAEKSELNKNHVSSAYPYYTAFVAVLILAAIACLFVFGLIFILLRRQKHAKALINSSKGNVAAYDNPSYKSSESASYNMEMNGMKSNTSTNGNSRDEA